MAAVRVPSITLNNGSKIPAFGLGTYVVCENYVFIRNILSGKVLLLFIATSWFEPVGKRFIIEKINKNCNMFLQLIVARELCIWFFRIKCFYIFLINLSTNRYISFGLHHRNFISLLSSFGNDLFIYNTGIDSAVNFISFLLGHGR